MNSKLSTSKTKYMYSFLQFCIHRKIVDEDVPEGRLQIAWEIYGNQYIEFCKDNKLQYEELRASKKGQEE